MSARSATDIVSTFLSHSFGLAAFTFGSSHLSGGGGGRPSTCGSQLENPLNAELARTKKAMLTSIVLARGIMYPSHITTAEITKNQNDSHP
jgi:hypothetical protein